jgi:hypothetical protein
MNGSKMMKKILLLAALSGLMMGAALAWQGAKE